jgi:hypothetical protein
MTTSNSINVKAGNARLFVLLNFILFQFNFDSAVGWLLGHPAAYRDS